MPGQNGKIVTTFISSSTTPAAGSGAWMSNARIAAQTARIWKIQPQIWKKIATAAPNGERMTPSPCRPIVQSRRTGPSPSTVISWCWRRAEMKANRKSPTPTPITNSSVALADDGMFAVETT